jgi:chitin-binding protein
MKLHQIKTFIKFLAIIISVVPFFMQQVLAHGYTTHARQFKCKTGLNTGCGAIQFEPQSVEGPDRFPQTGPVDGQIASAGNANWAPLNEQTSTRWHKRDVATGDTSFQWKFTARHRTRDFRYFITKQGWNPEQPLSRSAFELTPFCSVDGNDEPPVEDVIHQCDIPIDRTGYHVVLAVWDVADSATSFYITVDVLVENSKLTKPKIPAILMPIIDLLLN